MRDHSRLVRITLWLLPFVVLFTLYAYGLRVWFLFDDFAWLNLHSQIRDVPSFFAALFQPLAQGTVRPWSERLYFLLAWQAGGMESAWLLRGIAFATQTANVLLIVLITRRLADGSLLAGSAAALLWLCNGNLYVPMAWSSAYNQILCACFLLLALWLWIRYTDTGSSRLYWAQLAVFVLGFGALEINVVYPALAALFALCFDRRKYLPRTLPMFVISMLYAIVHRALAPKNAASDIYRLYFDTAIPRTLWTYVDYALGVMRYARLRKWPLVPVQTAEITVAVALFVFLSWMLLRRRWIAAFGLGWFLIVLAPVLPLKNHITDYYLFIPTIGLAISAAWGVSLVFRRGWLPAVAVSALLLAYVIPGATMAHGMTRTYFVDSHRARTLVRSVAYAHRLHPDKAIVLRGVDNSLFWSAVYDHAFRLFGADRTYLSSEDEENIRSYGPVGSRTRFFVTDREQLAGLQAGTLALYDVLPDARLRNVGEMRRAILARSELTGAARFISFGMKEATPFLLSGWWEPEANFRWTAKRAEFFIHGPDTAEGELVLTGVCPRQQVAQGPLTVSVAVEGQPLMASSVREGAFELRRPLPAALAGRHSIKVAVEVDRVLRIPGDQRELGVAFGTAEVLR